MLNKRTIFTSMMSKLRACTQIYIFMNKTEGIRFVSSFKYYNEYFKCRVNLCVLFVHFVHIYLNRNFIVCRNIHRD